MNMSQAVGVALMQACKKTGRAVLERTPRKKHVQKKATPASPAKLTIKKPVLQTKIVNMRFKCFTLKLEGFFGKFLNAKDIAGKVQVHTPPWGNMASKKPAIPASTKHEMISVDLNNLCRECR